MFSTISNKMIEFMIQNQIIDKENQEVYSYGLETIIASIVNTVIILLIGISFGYGMETVIFMLCYCPLRQFTGGYHASGYFKCLLSFVGVYLLTILIFTVSQGYIANIHIAVILLASCLGITFMAPVDNRNKPLEKEEKKRYKKTAIKLVCIEAFIIILLLTSNDIIGRYCIFGTLAIAWVTVLVLLGLIKNLLDKKGGNTNEEIN